jgi:hypothetical protein
MSDVLETAPETVEPEEITLKSLAARLDTIGEQLNWLTENMASLFAFVNQMGSSGGGLRGLMSMLKQTPQLQEQQNGDVPQ